MRIPWLAYRASWMLAALAVPLFMYDFGKISWESMARPIDLSRANVMTDSFRLHRAGHYFVSLGVAGRPADCVWGLAEVRCAGVGRQFNASWRVTAGGQVVLSASADTGIHGVWGSSDGQTGVMLGRFVGSADTPYEITLNIRSPAPDLMRLHPRLTVEFGPEGRDADLLRHAAAFLIAVILVVAALGSAVRTAQRRRGLPESG